MSSLHNIKKVPLEICNILGQNAALMKLLLDDTVDAEESNISSSNINDLIENGYISFCPPIESGIKNTVRNTMLTINMDSIFLYNSPMITAQVSIDVTTDMGHILLRNNKNRLLEMCDIICNLLNNAKLSSAGIAVVNTVTWELFSEFRVGYRILINISDEQGKKAEI